MDIKRNGSQPSGKGPAEWLTGNVRIDPLFQQNDTTRANGSSVTFEPGAWAAWHSHPLGQTLIVTAGCGLAQGWGEALPLTAYIALLFAAIALLAHPALALYIVSADMLVLLFVGIRNAWDLVIFLAVERSRPGNISSE